LGFSEVEGEVEGEVEEEDDDGDVDDDESTVMKLVAFRLLEEKKLNMMAWLCERTSDGRRTTRQIVQLLKKCGDEAEKRERNYVRTIRS